MWWWFALGCRIEVGPPGGDARTCADEAPSGEVWIYTSLYASVLDALEPALREALPGIEPRFFQAGSEKVAQRFEAEESAGGSPACLLLTSDPAWYLGLAAAGRLRPHLSPTVLQLDRDWVDPEGRWAASRVSVMAIGAPADLVDPPTRFSDLAAPRFAGRVSMPDPLASGTAFTWLAFATQDGWESVDALRAGGLVAAGGNAAVQSRVESGERPIGILLAENVLAAQRKGSPIQVIYPEDGAVAIPGPVAIPAGCPNPAAAAAVEDWLLSPAAQAILATGEMYPALPGVPGPVGAPPLDAIVLRPWTPAVRARLDRDAAAIKARWAQPP